MEVKYEMWCPNCNKEYIEESENERCYECPQCGGRVYRDRFLICECGKIVYLQEFTNECECGKLYNSFGQELAAPDEWDEEERYEYYAPEEDY